MPLTKSPELNRLARSYRIQNVYYDGMRRRRQAPAETVIAILKRLGAISSPADIPAAARHRRQQVDRRFLSPVYVAWDGEARIEVRVPAEAGWLRGQVRLENGEERGWRWNTGELEPAFSTSSEGRTYSSYLLALPETLPPGYHRLQLESSGESREALVISAPLKTYLPPEGEREWGVFLPLYALRRRDGWGGGDFADLRELMAWTSGLGGRVVGTLPFLASFLDEPFAPSPYTPASRLAWNELYVSLQSSPELQNCTQAQAIVNSEGFQKESAELRALPLTDYRREMALKRRILEELARCLYARPSERLSELEGFTRANPLIEDYARFRAAVAKQGANWRSWTGPMRDGALREGDWDEAVYRYHLYAQFLCHEQVAGIAETGRRSNASLYLDMPLGVHPDGYDVWRERTSFADGVSVGAPPDRVFTAGQDWRFPPLHPERIRERDYGYFIAYLRHAMKHAGLLRLDHVMGLHRLYWIPAGARAGDGAYVHCHPGEFYAILSLESHRNRTVIVGEDLGTVPPYVRPAMRRHGLRRLYVLAYELHGPSGLAAVPRDSVASLNTHDMAPFAAFREGLDIGQRRRAGLLNEKEADAERAARVEIRECLLSSLRRKGFLTGSREDTRAVLEASLDYLAASRGRAVLVNLEDLWLETEPQNLPSTGPDYPNWRRRARYSFDDFCQMPAVTATLRRINSLRQKKV